MTESEHASSDSSPKWVEDIGEAALALRELAQAQWQLLGAELRLARSAATLLLVATICAVVFGFALGLTLLVLLGFALSQWLSSWAWGLLVLAGLLLLGLIVAILLTRRCLHWLSLPRTRAQLHAAFARRQPARSTSSRTQSAQTKREATADEDTSQAV